ncbi:DNA/RNA nuclease SfsA [Streptomyces sp. NPDC000618]|uniref:DNA/RNA nuclease SfsA n=1 Tax=Streptomyces sp. NPDC000618 TaxID=3154265 RepID=UPI0033235200
MNTPAALTTRGDTIVFPKPLIRARIVRRPNRFIIDADLDGAEVACHCPTTGRIGNLVLDGLDCLLSPSHNPARKTPYTVEAVSVDAPGTARPAWIGINQNAANRYVEQALVHHLLPDIVTAHSVLREQTLGASRLDFLVDDTYVEVKTPLDHLQVTLGEHVRTRPRPPLASTDRLVKHIGELGHSLKSHQRAVLLVCFLYDNPGFRVQASSHHDEVHSTVAQAVRDGVEIWQVNFRLNASGVRVARYCDLTSQFLA